MCGSQIWKGDFTFRKLVEKQFSFSSILKIYRDKRDLNRVLLLFPQNYYFFTGPLCLMFFSPFMVRAYSNKGSTNEIETPKIKVCWDYVPKDFSEMEMDLNRQGFSLSTFLSYTYSLLLHIMCNPSILFFMIPLVLSPYSLCGLYTKILLNASN